MSELQIRINFYSTLKNTVGKDYVDISIEKGSTMKNILQNIQNDLFVPNNVKILKSDNNSLEVGLICLIDEVDLNLAGGLKRKIQKPVKITLISSLHGG